MVAPKGRQATQEAVSAAFNSCREILDEQVATSPIDWRTRFGAHPFFGTLDSTNGSSSLPAIRCRSRR